MYTKQWAFQLFVHNLPCAGVFFREDGKPQFHLLTKSFASILLKLATGAGDTLEGVEVWLEVSFGTRCTGICDRVRIRTGQTWRTDPFK
jgi:hypothetical protein